MLAVPGPVRSPGSELPNALLAEGCHPARDTTTCSLRSIWLRRAPVAPAASAPVETRPAPDPGAQVVLDALGWHPATFEQLVNATGRSPGEIGVALAHLERDGWVAGSSGWWEQRAGDGPPTG